MKKVTLLCKVLLIAIDKQFLKFYPIKSSKIIEDIDVKDANSGSRILKKICFELGIINLLFLDVGSNLGQEIAIIKELSAEYKFKFLCISFEPVPDLFQIITNKYKNEISTGILEVNQFAIGKPKKNKLYIKSWENNKNDGSSIYKHKSNITKNILEIKTFELSKILTAVELKKYSHVILKIDSEGSEYDIMKNLIKTNNINIFSYILLEDHSRKIKSLTWQINRLFVRRKLSKMNVTVDNW